jgi:hypothetical protein
VWLHRGTPALIANQKYWSAMAMSFRPDGRKMRLLIFEYRTFLETGVICASISFIDGRFGPAKFGYFQISYCGETYDRKTSSSFIHRS